MSLTQTWGNAAEIATAVVTAAGLIFAGRQLLLGRRATQAAQRTAEGEFLLRLEEIFSQQHFRQVAGKLRRGGGEWREEAAGPSAGEWTDAVDYMGMLELMRALVRNRSITIGQVADYYEYRFRGVWASPALRAKLLENARYWRDFILLSEELANRRGDSDDPELHDWRAQIDRCKEAAGIATE